MFKIIKVVIVCFVGTNGFTSTVLSTEDNKEKIVSATLVASSENAITIKGMDARAISFGTHFLFDVYRVSDVVFGFSNPVSIAYTTGLRAITSASSLLWFKDVSHSLEGCKELDYLAALHTVVDIADLVLTPTGEGQLYNILIRPSLVISVGLFGGYYLYKRLTLASKANQQQMKDQ